MIPVTIKGDGFGATLWSNLSVVNRIGDNYGQLCAISLAGHAQQIQAISAGLADASMSFTWDVSGTPLAEQPDAYRGAKTVERWAKAVMPAPGGFEVRKAKLAYDTWHLVAVSKYPLFFLHETDEAVWKVLRSDKFTTPLLRHWTPIIRESLHKAGALKSCDFFGRQFDKYGPPAYLLATDATLDKVVEEGVRKGRLRIERAA